MKRKGFTLLEILAVISLISLLVLFAFPLVIGIFRNAEKRALVVDARAIYNVAKDENLVQEQIVSDNEFCYSNSDYDNELELIEKEGVYYSIKFNNNYITSFEISTDKYYLSVDGSEGISTSDFKLEEVKGKGEVGYKEVSCIPLDACFEIVESESYITITDYDEYNPMCPRDVEIPEEINGKPVTVIGDGALQGKELTSIIIPNTVITIEDSAFAYNQLASVTIPSSVTSIGYWAFYRNQISTLTIPSSVTTIRGSAFTDNQLPDDKAFIYERNFDGTPNYSSLASYGGARRSNVVIPSGVTYIAYAAFFGTDLMSVTIPNTVTTISQASFRINQLTSLTIPTGVQYIGYEAFAQNLISELNLSNTVTSIDGEAFRDNLLSDEDAFIYKRNFDGTIDTTRLVAYGGARRSNVVIPSGVVTIDYNAFRFAGLSSITIPNTVTTINGDGFYGNSFTSITIPNSVTSIGSRAFGYGTLTSIAIPNSVTSIANEAFIRNSIIQGNATIDNYDGGVSIGTNAFAYNGADRNTTITPVYLR